MSDTVPDDDGPVAPPLGLPSWPPRTVPADLEARWRSEGMWTDDTLGQLLDRGLRARPDLACCVYSDVRPSTSTFADLRADALAVAGGLRGVLDDDGYLSITDRLKDVIIRGGENVSAVEVEELIARLPGVGEVAVVAGPDERFGERVCAFVRPGAAPPPDLDQVRDALRDAGLARQKWPEALYVVDDFPRTPSGKIQKAHLRTRLRAEHTGTTA